MSGSPTPKIKAAQNIINKLKSMPRGKLLASAGLGIFLFSWATQGHKKYKATPANKGQGVI